MDSSNARVVIVGAGHAGGMVTANLRQYGFEGAIVLIGDEPLAPYQRPPLSKAWLKGEADGDSLLLKEPDWYENNSVDLRLNTRAVAIDLDSRTVALSSGSTVGYDALVLATGARARPLAIPGAELDGVLALRTAADAEALKGLLGPGTRLAVIGGGYVGLEAAASALTLGGTATVLEREGRLLARVACEPLSHFYEAAHRGRGVDILTSASVTALEGEAGKVTAVVLADGRRIACDVALIGVGAVPNVELAQAAGLDCLDGVVVDDQARTSDPHVWAVGDVTFRPLPLYGRDGRLESVPSALELAKQAASAIAGRAQPPGEVPWFWSDQFDLKLQMAGLVFDCDQLVLRGDPDSERFALFHLRDGVIQAVEAVNAPQEFMGGRLLIHRKTPVDAAKLADLTVSMKDVAA